jgi:predicted RND superfamily exporter protein
MSPTRRFVRLLVAGRWPLLGVALVVAAASYWPATQVRFDYSIERMFAPDDPLLPPYERLKSRFGGNEIVLAVYADDQLLAPDGRGLERLGQVSRKLKQVSGVRDVLSLAEVNVLLEQLEQSKNLGGLLDLFGNKPADPWKGPALLDPQSPLAARYRDLFAGYTHSADGRTAAVVCMLETAPERQAGGGDPRGQTISDMEQIIRDLPDDLPSGVLAGEPVMVVKGFELLAIDGWRLGTWSTFLLGLTILICFRSLRWLVVSIAVVQWTLLVTKALLVASGLELSMVSSMLTAIVTVVGVATVMHLIVRYRELRITGQPPHIAFESAFTELFWPIVGALATDVAGFGSLWIAEVGPVQDFGTMMVVGSLLVLPAICLLVPALSLAGANDQRAALPGWGERQLGDWLSRSTVAIQARRKGLAASFVIVTLLAAAGAYFLEVESDFTRNFRRGSPLVDAYEFVETRLGGAGVGDVVIPAPATLDKEYLARVGRLEDRLRALTVIDEVSGKPTPALTKVFSLADAIEAAAADPLLAGPLSSVEMRAQALSAAMPNFIAALRSAELDEHGQGRLRIMLRARERQPAEQKRLLIADVERLAREEFPATAESSGAEVTGFFVLLTNLIESMLRDQWTTFAAATAGIFVMLLIAFRSLKLALVALVPNAFPIFVLMGLLGWLGFRINMGAAMIAAVSMGLSVDSSIHYLVSFRRARRSGKTVAAALADVQQTVGQAVIFSTLALIVGFTVLITSEFVPTIYFGSLVSLAMLGGLVGNLVALPLLLSWVERD